MIFIFVFSQKPNTVVLTKDGAIPAPALGEPKIQIPKTKTKIYYTLLQNKYETKKKQKLKLECVPVIFLVFVTCVPAT